MPETFTSPVVPPIAECPHEEPIELFINSDDGRDVDDVELKAYAQSEENLEIVGIATTHMIPDRRALLVREYMGHLGSPDVDIGVGSIFPMGEEHQKLLQYLNSHTIPSAPGTTYEGSGLIECFPPMENVLMDAIRKYGNRLHIIGCAPLTDLAKFAEKNPEEFASIGGLHMQAQARRVGGDRLEPDFSSYNLNEDPVAAHIIFGFQDRVPMTFAGKEAAYKLTLTRHDFGLFESTGNPAGHYLKRHALLGIASFAARQPDVFRRVFGVDARAVAQIQKVSHPYDVVTGIALAHPEMLEFEEVGHHRLVGMTPENHGVIDPSATKQHVVDSIMRVLMRPPMSA